MRQEEVPRLSQEEFERLARAATETRDNIILRTLYETGCTVHELVAIRVHDVSTHTCTIHFTSETSRTKAHRASRIGPQLCHDILPLTLHKQPTEHILTSRQNGQITTKRVRQIIQKLGETALGRTVNPQELRYTHIAHALAKNIPVTAIQEQVGLDSLRMTQLAGQLAPKRITNAYETFFKTA